MATPPVAFPAAAPAAPVTTEVRNGALVEFEADLMTAADSVAHCVSACMAMGKGIAVLFKQRFGRVDELKAQQAQPGGLAVLRDGDRFVYYLVTKPRYYDKPTYDTLRSSLAAMFGHMREHGITRVAMPEIGCGLDGLQWPGVKAVLLELLADSGLVATVYRFKPPPGHPAAVGRGRGGRGRGRGRAHPE